MFSVPEVHFHLLRVCYITYIYMCVCMCVCLYDLLYLYLISIYLFRWWLYRADNPSIFYFKFFKIQVWKIGLDFFFFLLEITLDKEISWFIVLRHTCFAIPVVLNIESNLVSNIVFALIDLSLLIKVLKWAWSITNLKY